MSGEEERPKSGGDERDANTKALIKLAQSGDGAAKERVVKENLGLVWSIARKFSKQGLETQDLFQIGAIGLIKCVEKFDMTNYSVKFSTYAVPMIMGEIRRFLRDDGMIKVARPLKELAKKARRAYEELSQKSGAAPAVSEVAEYLGIEAEEVVMALEADRDVESLYSSASKSDDGNPIYLMDKIDKMRPRGGTEADEADDKIALKEAIATLAEKERQIIIMRYFLDKTQADVAKIIGVSQVQVSRIEKRVLSRMREKMA